MAVCGGTNCNKALECERYIGNNIQEPSEYIDYSTWGSGTAHNSSYKSMCGDDGGYRLFHQVSKPNKGLDNNDEQFLNESLHKLGIRYLDEDGKPKSTYRILGELAQQINYYRYHSEGYR